MKSFCKGLWEAMRTQVTGHKRPHIWTATTRSGKVVVIEGDRVVSVVDPQAGRKGTYVK